MKMTLEEVLDNYTILSDFIFYVDHDYDVDHDGNVDDGQKIVHLQWNNTKSNCFADYTQTVKADGEFFTVEDENGKVHQFQAAKIIRLDDVPELL